MSVHCIPYVCVSLWTGDESEEEQQLSEDEDSESDHGHTQPPAGAVPVHHNDGREHDGDESDNDGCSTGVSEANTQTDELCEELSDAGEGMEEATGGSEEMTGGVTGGEGAAGRVKKFHLSEVWKRLEALSKKDGYSYTALPLLVGLGVHRHASGNFWSARFPGEPWFTCRLGEARDEFNSLLTILRHVIKLYIRTAPADRQSWEVHLEKLSALRT